MEDQRREQRPTALFAYRAHRGFSMCRRPTVLLMSPIPPEPRAAFSRSIRRQAKFSGEWKPRTYVNPSELGLQGSLYCPNTVSATPTFDRRTNILYTIAIDGALYGLDMGSGEVRFGPVQFVAAYSKGWSLNLVGDTIYTTLAQGCGGALSGNLFDGHQRPPSPRRAPASARQYHHRRHLGTRRSYYRRRRPRLRLDGRRALRTRRRGDYSKGIIRKRLTNPSPLPLYCLHAKNNTASSWKSLQKRCYPHPTV